MTCNLSRFSHVCRPAYVVQFVHAHSTSWEDQAQQRGQG